MSNLQSVIPVPRCPRDSVLAGRPRHRGMALLMVLTMLGIMGVLIAVVAATLSASVSATNQQRDQMAARLAAEAGLARQLAALRADPAAANVSFRIASAANAPPADVTVQVERKGDQFELTSTARLIGRATPTSQPHNVSAASRRREETTCTVRCTVRLESGQMRVVKYAQSTGKP